MRAPSGSWGVGQRRAGLQGAASEAVAPEGAEEEAEKGRRV
jgi:hypothetical protein